MGLLRHAQYIADGCSTACRVVPLLRGIAVASLHLCRSAGTHRDSLPSAAALPVLGAIAAR